MLFLFMLIDGLAPPIGLNSIVARSNGSHFTMDGRFLHGTSVPVLFWPKENSVWINYCANKKDLCCLKDMCEHYRNDKLQSVLSEQCLSTLPSDLVTASAPDVQLVKSGQFHAVLPTSTHFVGFLFINMEPFYIIDAYQNFKMVVDGVVESNFIIAHNPCYSVIVPNTMVSICMHCNNPLPANAKFVWTQNWYVNYECDWQCSPSYVKSGQSCEYVKLDLPLLQVGFALSASFIVVFILFCLFKCRRSQKVIEPPVKEEEEKPVAKSDMIQFKGDLKELQLRVKRN